MLTLLRNPSVLLLAMCLAPIHSLAGAADARPWMNAQLPPDERAALVLREMTLDEKIQLAHGEGWGILQGGEPQAGSNCGSGFARGIPRLGIPNMEMDDCALGVRLSAYQGRYSTALPSTLGAAASWNTDAALLYGQVIGRELRAQGYNTGLGGGVNLTREPRCGRVFEYAGEDPVLSGQMLGHLIKGIQSQQVLGTIKHYAFNDQETGRMIGNVIIDQRAARESDLLAFEIALRISDAAIVMASYNKFNGVFVCENDYLLNQVLKGDFGFKGIVMSDWEATHSTVPAALAGLDQEQPFDRYFGEELKKAVQRGEVPMSRLDDMAKRILRSLFAVGVIDNPPVRQVVNPFRGLADAQSIIEQSLVLLRNEASTLPLPRDVASIAIIGGHADIGVIGGGGSSRVDVAGGDQVPTPPGLEPWMRPAYYPSSPLAFIRAKVPEAKVEYDSGTDCAAAARLAAKAQIAIVFVTQPLTESRDAASLSLPDRQDDLVAAVAEANPRTIVVIESGGPVTMPWIDRIAAVLEAWYPGIGGGQAIANVLFGDVNPSGKLPISFPHSEADLPHPQIAGWGLPEGQAFDIPYPEGARIGYKWFESEAKQPLFPFGFGLSYTNFAYSRLSVNTTALEVSFRVINQGKRAGTEVAQVYARLPDSVGEKHRRLVAWARVPLCPGESRIVTVQLDRQALSYFDTAGSRWVLPTGNFEIQVGPSSSECPLRAVLEVTTP